MIRLEVSLRPVDEVQQLRDQVKQLRAELDRKQAEVSRFSQYAVTNLRYLDIINECRRRLIVIGEDVSWIDVK